MSIIVTKTCRVCGKIEQMAASLDLCLLCRLKAKKNKEKERKAIYYLENREKRRAYAREYYRKSKAPIKKKEGGKKRPHITVHFEKTEGGYCWKAWFRNPETERLVKFESDGYFPKLKDARDDYYEAIK